MQCEQNGLVDVAFPGILVALVPSLCVHVTSTYFKMPDAWEELSQNMALAADIGKQQQLLPIGVYTNHNMKYTRAHCAVRTWCLTQKADYVKVYWFHHKYWRLSPHNQPLIICWCFESFWATALLFTTHICQETRHRVCTLCEQQSCALAIASSTVQNALIKQSALWRQSMCVVVWAVWGLLTDCSSNSFKILSTTHCQAGLRIETHSLLTAAAVRKADNAACLVPCKQLPCFDQHHDIPNWENQAQNLQFVGKAERQTVEPKNIVGIIEAWTQ